MLHPSSSLPLLAWFAALSGAAGAQTFVVDSANGPGTNFTDIPAAVNAVPSGATLHVRPGGYSPFFVSGKSLSVIGHRSATGQFPNVNANALFRAISIANIAAGQAVTISGLQFSGPSSGITSAEVIVSNCAGPVVIEDLSCSFTASYPFSMNVTNCSNVHASRLTLSGFLVTNTTPSNPPLVVRNSTATFMRLSSVGYRAAQTGVTATAGMVVMQQSRVVLGSPSVSGGPALSSQSACGPGVIVEGGSTVQALGNAGFGAASISGGSGVTGPGGVGMVVRGASSARVRGLTVSGGFGMPAGQPFTVDATSTLSNLPAIAAPIGSLVGDVRPGNTVNYTLHATGGQAAWMLLGTRAEMTALPVVAQGVVEVTPLVLLTLGSVPGSGVLQLPSLVPNGWPDNFVLVAQFLAFDFGRNELAASNLFTATSRY